MAGAKGIAANVDVGQIIGLVTSLGTAALNARAAYDEAKALAVKLGVSKADLDRADERFAHVYTDPLHPEQPS